MKTQRIAVEYTEAEAAAVSAFLNGLGWGSVDAVKEIRTAREKLDTAIRIERDFCETNRRVSS